MHRSEITPLDNVQVSILLHQTKGNRYYPAYLLTLATGLRLGELLGLRWQNVDLSKGILQVRQTLERVSTGAKEGRSAQGGLSRLATYPRPAIPGRSQYKGHTGSTRAP